MAETVTLRPQEPGDEAFLAALYASTRVPDFAHLPWSSERKQEFLLSQFRLQSAHYRMHYPGAELWIILQTLRPIGRICTHRGPSGIRLMDIALLPRYRNRGIGGQCLRDLLADAALAGQGVTAHVAQDNPARRLYERLGFSVAAEREPYQLLVWSGLRPGPTE